MRIAVLGATGSIGRQALDVIARLDEQRFGGKRWRVQSLAADGSIATLAQLARQHEPAVVSCAPTKAAELNEALADTACKVVSGEDGLAQLATDPAADIVLLAVYGLAALPPLIAAVEHGKRIALASKEALVAGGRFIMPLAAQRGATLLPVDSEHSALFQLLDGRPSDQIRRAVLTASGGPFRRYSAEQLGNVTYAQAQAHPTWSMGAGITLNSATLFNKGLELIEAHHLFGLTLAQLDVLIEPTSRVHAAVELSDGSLLLHAGTPDMRTPIQLALTLPERAPSAAPPLDLAAAAIEFEPVNHALFPALSACRAALAGPWWLPAALLGVNEVLSARFSTGELPFTSIGSQLKRLTDDPDQLSLGSLEEAVHEIYRVDLGARRWAAAVQ